MTKVSSARRARTRARAPDLERCGQKPRPTCSISRGACAPPWLGERRARALEWDGKDDDGRLLAPGLYFARAEALGETTKTRFVLAR
jgi:hypothetical protein